jgi:hypothetical protein
MDREFVVGLAKSLQFSCSKSKLGTPVKWREIDAQDRLIWERLARMAIKRITNPPEPNASRNVSMTLRHLRS